MEHAKSVQAKKQTSKVSEVGVKWSGDFFFFFLRYIKREKKPREMG